MDQLQMLSIYSHRHSADGPAAKYSAHRPAADIQYIWRPSAYIQHIWNIYKYTAYGQAAGNQHMEQQQKFTY
jgi:hypothetical protein